MTAEPTRYAAYAVTSTGRVRRHPFASFPHGDAARRWVDAHPAERVKFVPDLSWDPADVVADADAANHDWLVRDLMRQGMAEDTAEAAAAGIEADAAAAPRLTPTQIARLRRLFNPRA